MFENEAFQYSSLCFEHKVLDDFWLPSVLVFFKILSDIFNVFFYLEQFRDLRVQDLCCLWTDKISKICFCCSCMKFTEKKGTVLSYFAFKFWMTTKHSAKQENKSQEIVWFFQRRLKTTNQKSQMCFPYTN